MAAEHRKSLGPAESSKQEDVSYAQGPRAPPKKRRRIVISCTECHRRKQKCDRDLPCANCKSRNKAAACQYETGAPTAKEHDKTSLQNGQASNADAEPSTLSGLQGLSNVAAGLGYSNASGSTLGLLKRIERANDDMDLTGPDLLAPVEEEQFAVKERYRSLIRQLPPKLYIQKLVDVYFKELNPAYYMVEEDLFYEQLSNWNNLSFSVLSSSGPQGLSPDLRAFPGLLFQTLANALLILKEGPHEFYDHLKYAGNMTFEDLASDYSDSGVSIINLLSRRSVTLTTVQASFIRANFLKYTGRVNESWHSISMAIKEAQQIGMHSDKLDPQPQSDALEDVLENMWHIERRRRIYMALSVWDLHCSVVLGKPGTIDFRAPSPSLPLDTPLPKERRKTPLALRVQDRDPPTVVTKLIVVCKVVRILIQIKDLELDGPCPKDYGKVQSLHDMALEAVDQVPAYFRMENPDTRWDGHPECRDWLQEARYYVQQVCWFNFLALHRPYVFHRFQSRKETLEASLGMLHVQRETFRGLDPKSWRNYQLFFGSFDAVVLIASTFILFPDEHGERAEQAQQEVQWTMERMHAIAERNSLAKAAGGVLRAINLKLRKTLERRALSARSASTVSTSTILGGSSTSSGPGTTVASTATPLADGPPLDTYGDGGGTAVVPQLAAPAATLERPFEYPEPLRDWAMPAKFDLSNMAPLFPMGDIVYNDLSILDGPVSWGGTAGAMGTSMVTAPPAAAPTSLATLNTFEGDFDNESFWSLMNQFNGPAPGM